MGKIDDLRSSLSLLVKRNYFLDRWMGDESLLSILHSQYNLHHINKYYLNRYITNIGLNDVTIFQHQEDYLFNDKTSSRRTFFYIFTTENTCPKKLSREGFITCFSNLRVLRSDPLLSPSTSHTNKRKTTTFERNNIVSPEENKMEIEQLKINIGNYFTSITTKKLFGCKADEEVYDCLSRRIDTFDEVLNDNLPIWKVVNKCDKKSMHWDLNTKKEEKVISQTNTKVRKMLLFEKSLLKNILNWN